MYFNKVALLPLLKKAEKNALAIVGRKPLRGEPSLEIDTYFQGGGYYDHKNNIIAVSKSLLEKGKEKVILTVLTHEYIHYLDLNLYSTYWKMEALEEVVYFALLEGRAIAGAKLTVDGRSWEEIEEGIIGNSRRVGRNNLAKCYALGIAFFKKLLLWLPPKKVFSLTAEHPPKSEKEFLDPMKYLARLR